MAKLMVVLLSFAVAGSGCSIFGVRAAKTKYDVGCTSDLYAPAVDLAATTANLYAAIAYDEARWLSLLGFAAYLGSAIHGYIATGTCAKAKNAAFEYQTELLEQIGENANAQGNTAKPVPRRKPAPSQDAIDLPAPSVTPADGEEPSR